VTTNYYPINSAISVVDAKTSFKFTVLNDRSQGGSVLEDGRIELMQNRRLFKDDGKGVEECMNETD
jgi:lysosomal alpha-mannosidase